METALVFGILFSGILGVLAAAALWIQSDCVVAAAATAVITVFAYAVVTRARKGRSERARGPG